MHERFSCYSVIQKIYKIMPMVYSYLMTKGEKTSIVIQFIYRWLPAIVVMILIFAMSSMSSQAVAEQVGPITSPLVVVQRNTSLLSGLSDLPWLKIGHIVGYGLLGICVWRAFYLAKHDVVWLPVFICFLYACSDEFHQNFVPGRSGSFADVVLDTVAALAAIEIVRFLRAWAHGRKLWRQRAEEGLSNRNEKT